MLYDGKKHERWLHQLHEILDLILNKSPRQFNPLQQVIQEKKKKIKTQSQKTNNKPTTVSLGYKVGMLYTPLKQGSIICF